MKKTIAAAIAMTAGSLAVAQPILDARTIASAGAGVSEGRDAASIRHNPGHIAGFNPAVGSAWTYSLALASPTDADIYDDLSETESAVGAFSSKNDARTLQASDADNLTRALQSIAGEPALFAADTTLTVAVPTRRLSWGLTFSQRVLASGEVMYSQDDARTLESAARVNDGRFQESDLKTRVLAEGLEVSELGLTMGGIAIKIPPDPLLTMTGKEFPAQIVRVGVSLRLQQITVAELNDRINESGDDYNTERHTTGNIDIGFTTNLTSKWQWGGAIRNLIPQTLDGPDSAEYEIGPELAMGLTYTEGPMRLMGEAMVRTGAGFDRGVEGDKLSLASAWAVNDWLEARLGLGVEFADHENRTEVTLGVGMGRDTGFRFDVGMFSNNVQGTGAALQFAFAI